MFNIIKKREGEVPSGGGWQTEGKTVRVTRQDVKIFQILCDDSCFMAQRVMWYLMMHRIRDAAEDSSSGHDEDKEQVRKSNQGDWRKPKTRVKG